MNNKGFTLIELIMVITILTMVGLIATPNVIKFIKQNKVDNYNNTIDSIIEASKLYVSENRNDLNFENNDFCIPGETKDLKTSVNLGIN